MCVLNELSFLSHISYVHCRIPRTLILSCFLIDVNLISTRCSDHNRLPFWQDICSVPHVKDANKLKYLHAFLSDRQLVGKKSFSAPVFSRGRKHSATPRERPTLETVAMESGSRCPFKKRILHNFVCWRPINIIWLCQGSKQGALPWSTQFFARFTPLSPQLLKPTLVLLICLIFLCKEGEWTETDSKVSVTKMSCGSLV